MSFLPLIVGGNAAAARTGAHVLLVAELISRHLWETTLNVTWLMWIAGVVAGCLFSPVAIFLEYFSSKSNRALAYAHFFWIILIIFTFFGMYGLPVPD